MLSDSNCEYHNRTAIPLLPDPDARKGVVLTFTAFIASLVIEAILALEIGGLPSLRELSYRWKKQFTSACLAERQRGKIYSAFQLSNKLSI